MNKGEELVVKLDMESAVLFVENGVNASKDAFFVETEFGRIAVESYPKGIEGYGQVEVSTWEDAPPTRWARMNSYERCDYHCIIMRGKTRFGTHSRVIEAMSTCMLMELFEEVPEEILDAAIKVYINDIDFYVPSINFLEEEYVKNHFGLITRHNSNIRDLVRGNIRQREMSASMVIGSGRALSLTKHGSKHGSWDPDYIYDFDHGYNRTMMYVILYALYALKTPRKMLRESPRHVSVINSNDGYIDMIKSADVFDTAFEIV